MIDASLAATRQFSFRSQNWPGVEAVATCLVALMMVSFAFGERSNDGLSSRKESNHQPEDVNQSDEPQQPTDEDTHTFEKQGGFIDACNRASLRSSSVLRCRVWLRT